jgi:hypothetical protein
VSLVSGAVRRYGPCGLCGRLWTLDELAGELPDLANFVVGKLCPECYDLHYNPANRDAR